MLNLRKLSIFDIINLPFIHIDHRVIQKVENVIAVEKKKRKVRQNCAFNRSHLSNSKLSEASVFVNVGQCLERDINQEAYSGACSYNSYDHAIMIIVAMTVVISVIRRIGAALIKLKKLKYLVSN